MTLTFPNYDPRPYTSAQPFTYQDGLTYLEVLESLREWLNTVLVPHVNTEVGGLTDDWAEGIAAIQGALTQAIADNAATVDARLDTNETAINAAIQAVIDSSISVSDPVVRGVLEAAVSSTREWLDTRYATKAEVDAVPTQAENDDRYVPKTLVDSGRLSAAALEDEFGDEAIADRIYNPASATRQAFNNLYTEIEADESYVFTDFPATYFTNLEMSDTSVMQALVVDETTNAHLFTSQQAIAGAYGTEAAQTLKINRHTLDGELLDSMTLEHAGHGTIFHLEHPAGTNDVYIWTHYYRAGSVVGGASSQHGLARIKYAAGAVYNENSPQLEWYNTLVPADKDISVCGDQKNGNILFRDSTTDTEILTLRKLSDVKAGINNPLRSITVPTAAQPADMMQGAAVDGNTVYWLYGHPLYAQAGQTKPILSQIDLNTGDIVTQHTNWDLGKLPNGTYEDNAYEPEGVYLYRHPITGRRTLFAGTVTGSAGRRNWKVYAYHEPENAVFFQGERAQRYTPAKTAEIGGKAMRMPYGVTNMKLITEPGTYYMSTAESAALTDHPEPNTAGWFLEVLPKNASGHVVQKLYRNSAGTSSQNTRTRVVQSSTSASDWIRNIPRMFAGSVTITPSAAETNTSVTVTFPDGAFSTTPIVVCTPQVNTLTGNIRWGVASLSATGFTLWIRSANTTAFPMQWIACDHESM